MARDVDADDLRAALEAHGFEAEAVSESGDLEVRYARDEAERLAADLAAALEVWIGARQLPLVPAQGDGVLALRPPGDSVGVVSSRARRRAHAARAGGHPRRFRRPAGAGAAPKR